MAHSMAWNKENGKKIFAEAATCNNFYRKRHNKKTLTRTRLGIHLGQCKCSAEIFQAEICSRSYEDRTELVNLFDRSTNQPLFSAVLTVLWISLRASWFLLFITCSIMWPLCTAAQQHLDARILTSASSVFFWSWANFSGISHPLWSSPR